jgi:hypothetical protein
MCSDGRRTRGPDLRAIDIKLDREAEDMREIKTRVGGPASTTSMPGSIASSIGC